MSTSFQAYDGGGFTGAGGKYDPAGVVHKGEFVFTKEATERIGVENLYGMMRGYGSGGLVDAPTERPTTLSGNGRAGGNTIIQVDAPVTIMQESGAGDASATGTSAAASQLKSIVQQTITDRLKKEISPGGILYSGRS